MAGTYKTRDELFTAAGAPFATGATPSNQDFQDLGASFCHLGDMSALVTVERSMASAEYFDNSATCYVLDPAGAARNFDPNPATSFTPGQLLAVVNVADASETITVDSTDLAYDVAQGKAALFVYTTDGWRTLAVLA